MDLNKTFCEIANDAIDKGIIRENKRQSTRNYLGGSRLGVECKRALQYEYLKVKKDIDFSPKTLRIFQAGHLYEDLAVKWMRGAGIEILTENEDGEQFGFESFKGKIAGHVDGIITFVPELLKQKTPMLWECKSLNNKNFNDLVKNGLKKSKEVYYTQVNIYSAFMEDQFKGISDNPAWFTAINKDTCEIYHELIPFDGSVAQRDYDSAVKLIEQAEKFELLERPYVNGFYKCRFCSWKEKCWGDNDDERFSTDS